MSKRTLNDPEASSSPRKRIRSSSRPRASSSSTPHTPAPQTPWRTSPPRTAPHTPYPPCTPHTPYTPYPLRALDSPSNPFGRRRRERLAYALPPPTSFAKHLALRLQFVRMPRCVPPRMGGVYRTVRVPASYTFAHVRALVAWLFGGSTGGNEGKGKGRSNGEEGYLFEVKAKAVMYGPLYKPGQIKQGVTTVKVSNVRDPARWEGCGLDTEEEDELLSQEHETEVDIEEIMDEDWKWADEEDFTLGHVWPVGLDPTIGIIYYHSADTQVHITLNQTKLPRQRGTSNTPHVFNARGRVHLSPQPLPRPRFTQSALDALSSSPAAPTRYLRRQPAVTHDEDLSDADADGDDDADVHAFTPAHPFFDGSPSKRAGSVILVLDSDDEEDDDDGSEDYDAQPALARWNEPDSAFAAYFARFMGADGTVPCAEEAAYDPFENDDDLVDGKVQAADEKMEEEDDDEDEEENLADSEGADEAGEDAEYDDAVGDDDNEGSQDEEEEEEDVDDVHQYTLGSTPDLTHHGSSASSLPASSPQRARSSSNPSSPGPFPFASEASIILEEHYPNRKYTKTPAPPRARPHRLRLGRLERRMEKLKKDEFLTKYDEVEEEEEAVDELGDEDEGDGWKPPVLKEGEVWDPFGDEVELL